MFNSTIPDAIFFFLIGACCGSFANVAIFRFGKKMNLAFPSSHCYSCSQPIAWYDNIPILSWLILRGKCRKCGAAISWRYFATELLTATLFCLAFLKLGLTWTFLEVLILFLGLVIVTGIDFDHFLLPDIYTLPGMVIGLVGALLNPDRSILDSVIGLILGGGFLWAIAYFYYLLRKEEGMGGGDIKLLAWIGAVLGWQSISFVIICSSLVGSIAGLIVSRSQKKGLKTVIPFGPYLALGAVVYVLAGQWIADEYARFFLPFLFEST